MHVLSNTPFDTEMDMFPNSFPVRMFVRKPTETEVLRHNASKNPLTNYYNVQPLSPLCRRLF